MGSADAAATTYFSAYAVVLTVVLAGLVVAVAAFTTGRLLRAGRPTATKLLTYESGVDPVGEGWAQVHVRYYVFAYLFVIFAVDVIYLFPWATVYAAPAFGWATLAEMFVFVGFLAVGLVYAWRKGVLRWT